MSYEIIKSIVIKDGKVIVRASSNNVSPKHFDPWECSSLTKILTEQGQDALDLEIMKQYESGCFQRGDNKWTRALLRLRNMPEYPTYDWRAPDYEAVTERRKSPEFEALLMKALKSSFPAQKYTISQVYGCGRVYLAKAGHHAKFVMDRSRAKLFHYEREARLLCSCYVGGSSWEVRPA